MSRIESLQQEILGLAPEEREALTRWLAEQSPTKATECPKTLYRYMDAKGIAGLENDELMFSSPTDTNDPFEFLTSLKSLGLKRSPGAQRTSVAEKWQRLAAQNSFLLFLSEQPLNPRMWAQYGGGHEGVVLELDCTKGQLGKLRSDGHFLKVQYHKNRRIDLPARKRKQKGLTSKDFKALVTHKGPDWSHEKEWRVYLHRNQTCTGSVTTNSHPAQLRLLNGLMKAFLRIEPECITKVILGYRSSPQLLNTVLQIKASKNAKWQVTRAILSLDSHSFDEERIER